MKQWWSNLGARLVIGLLWLLHWLPLSVLCVIGRGIGALLWQFGRSRRHVALTNLRLCFPEWTDDRRRAVAREHFALLGRSLIERGVLWFASEERLKRLVHVRGDVKLGERTEGPMMWLLPHFVGLEWTAPALMLHQDRPAVDVYQVQSHPVFNERMLAGRMRFSEARSRVVSRHEGIRPVLRFMKEGFGFVNAPDMDFGPKDSAFVPFFNVPTCTLLAPSRLARSMGAQVQPIVVTMLDGGKGIEVFFADAIPDYPSDDPEADARRFNAWLESHILAHPAQYFWVHKRFKTRPPGEPGVY